MSLFCWLADPTQCFHPLAAVKTSSVPKEVKFSECVNKTTVNLFANGKDAEGEVSYKWEQVKGEQVSLNQINLGQNQLSQVAFNLEPPSKAQTLSFVVTVQHGNGLTDTDEISIQISDPEDPDSPAEEQPPKRILPPVDEGGVACPPDPDLPPIPSDAD
jgi:hypothetical protein